MPYPKTTWVEGETKLGPTNLNNLEDGVAAAPYGPDGMSDQVPVGDGAGGWEIRNLTSSDVALGNVTNALQLLASQLDTDGTFAANSDTRVASQKATKTYADQLLAASSALSFKGVLDCSANPNYPAASVGFVWIISVAGKIGGASGVSVGTGDMVICITANAGGTQAAVGGDFAVVSSSLAGAVTGPVSAVNGNLATFNGASGTVIKDSAVSVADLAGTNVKITYGAKGDSTNGTDGTDDTAAFQAAINALIPLGRSLYVPAGIYRITAPLAIPAGSRWRIEGESSGRTIIVQNTANTPIFWLGQTETSGWTISGIKFQWANPPAPTDTKSCPIYFGVGTTLNGAIDDSQTTITVAAASLPGWPKTGNYIIRIDGENMLVTSGQGTTTWTVTRGYNSTTLAAHSDAAGIVMRVSATSGSIQFYNWIVSDCRFAYCYYALGSDSTKANDVWGGKMRDCTFDSTVTGGIVSLLSTGGGGQPNNSFDHIYARCDQMVGPIFEITGGTSTSFDAIELNVSSLGPLIIRDTSATGGSYVIGSLKSEGGTYDSSGGGHGAFFSIPNCQLVAGLLLIETIILTSASMTRPYLFDSNGATGGTNIKIADLRLYGWTVTGTYYLTNHDPAAGGRMVIDELTGLPTNCLLTNIPGAGSADAMTVTAWNDYSVSADKGNADYTFAPGDPNIVSFETALTANRTVTLPNPASNSNCFNGLRVRIVRSAGGSFNLLVKDPSITIDTIANPASLTPVASTIISEFVYRRNKWIHTARDTW